MTPSIPPLPVALREIEREICALRIDAASVSTDADGVISIDEIMLAPKNGTKYRLVLAVSPEEGDALNLYEAPDGNAADPAIPPATVESWYRDEVSA